MHTGSYAKDLKALAAEYGYTLDMTRGQHYRLRHPRHPGVVIASLTPRSAERALANTESLMKRLNREHGVNT